MKKLLAILLSCIIISAVMPLTCTAEGFVDVAAGRPGFASWIYGDCEADFATDGNKGTMMANSGVNPWYYVDLGKAYPINQIKILWGNTGNTEHRSGWSVILSNTRMTEEDENRVEVYFRNEEASVTDYTEINVPEEYKTQAYRYVAVNKVATGSAIAIAEIEVYTDAQNVSPDDTYLVNIAKNKAAFANSFMPGWEAWKMVDGTYNSNGTYTSRGSANTRAVIDLGASYNVEAFEYLARNAVSGKKVNIYVADSVDGSAKTKVYASTEENPLPYYPTVPAYIEITPVSGRYIIIDKEKSAGDLAISEIKVYTNNNEAKKESVSKKSILISRELPTIGSRGNTNDKYLNSQNITELYSQNYMGEMWAMIDLGKPCSLDYAAFTASCATDSYRSNFKIVATNDPDFEYGSYDCLYYQEGAAPNDEMEVIPVPEEFRNNKYRYVGVRGIPGSDGKARIMLSHLDFYTNEDRFETESVIPFVIKANDEAVTGTTKSKQLTLETKITIKNNKGSYKAAAAAYDESGKLMHLIMQDIAAAANGSYNMSASTANFDFASFNDVKNIASVKFMLLGGVDSTRPVMASKSVKTVYYDLREVAHSAASGQTSCRNSSEGMDKAIDDDLNTLFWIFNAKGLGYVDFGEPITLESIEILGYCNVNPQRASNYKVYLMNVQPTNDTPVGEDKVLIHEQKQGFSSADGALVTIEVPSEYKNKPFRYLSIEKLDTTEGLKIYDLKAYTKE